jgi:hypothetical protein
MEGGGLTSAFYGGASLKKYWIRPNLIEHFVKNIEATPT